MLALQLEMCAQTGDINFNSLKGKWNRAHEEEKEKDTWMFRPDSHELPPARGREMIEFLSDNKVIYYPIAPADGNLRRSGTYTLTKKKNEITINYDSDDKRDVFVIVQLSDSILVLSPRY